MHHSSLSRDRSNFLKSSSSFELEKNGGKMKNRCCLRTRFCSSLPPKRRKRFCPTTTFRKKRPRLFTRACVRACVSLFARLRCCVGVFFYSFETDALRLYLSSSEIVVASKSRPYSAVASINKKAFVDAVAKAANVEKKVAENVINAALGVVTASVAAGEKITLTGFGTFERKMRAAREGRNPATGEPLKIPASAYPSFSAGKGFKDAVKK